MSSGVPDPIRMRVTPLHVTPHRLTCPQAPGIMKTQPNPSDREVLAGLVERVTYSIVRFRRG